MLPQEDNQEIQRATLEPPGSLQSGASPLWPQHLINLFVRPRRFFSSQLAFGQTLYVVIVTWCYGVANAIDRIDQELVRAEVGRPRRGWEQLAPMITESWLGFWAWVLAFGAIGGLLLWLIGGWWYRVRLKWSGAHEPDKRLARLVYVYSSFVQSGPVVAFTLVSTIVYADYAQAYASESSYAVLLLLFPFWSLISSYLGVLTLFEVSRWKARIWFVILPGLLYIVALGLAVALFAFLGE
jgi:Yip1 domain